MLCIYLNIETVDVLDYLVSRPLKTTLVYTPAVCKWCGRTLVSTVYEKVNLKIGAAPESI